MDPIEILLTGASGFVGRHLASALAADHHVIALAREAGGAFDAIAMDLSQPLNAKRLPQRVDAVVHCAAVVGASAASEAQLQHVNVEATRALGEYAVRAGASRFLFCSTGGVYRPARGRLDENSPVGPADDYGRSKLAAEQALGEFSGALALQVLRLFFPYGPGQGDRLVPRLAARIARGEAVSLRPEDGGPLLSPLHVDDLVAYLLRTLALTQGFIANVPGAEAVSMRELATTIGRLVDREPVFIDAGAGADADWCADNARISALTGHAPRVTLADGLARTIAAGKGGS